MAKNQRGAKVLKKHKQKTFFLYQLLSDDKDTMHIFFVTEPIAVYVTNDRSALQAEKRKTQRVI